MALDFSASLQVIEKSKIKSFPKEFYFNMIWKKILSDNDPKGYELKVKNCKHTDKQITMTRNQNTSIAESQTKLQILELLYAEHKIRMFNMLQGVR